jgi:hypothetical protein
MESLGKGSAALRSRCLSDVPFRFASTSARVRPVGRPILPSGLRHGATHTPRDLSKYGSGWPLGARPTTTNESLAASWTRLPRGGLGMACLLRPTSVGLLRRSVESYLESNAPRTSLNVRSLSKLKVLPSTTFLNGRERPETWWRRWTGIEPAGRGSLVPAALKAVESTRYPDTSGGDCSGIDFG